MSRRFQKLILPLLLSACSAIASSQNLNPRVIDGRWNLAVETARQHPKTLVVDIRIEEGGKARLVILTPAPGGDGLFTGSVVGNRFLLKGEYDLLPVELDLVVDGDRVNGKMAGGNQQAEVHGQRLPVAPPEVSVKQYGLLFDAVWNGVGRHFYDRQFNGVDPAAVKLRHLPSIKAARNDGELAVAIRRSLRELRTSNTDFFLPTVKHYVTSFEEGEERRLRCERIEPDVSYLTLSNFTADDLRRFDLQLDSAMGEIVKYPALVIDLRGNRGENLEAALLALNFLIPEGRPIAYFATRRGLDRLGLPSIDRIIPSSLPSAYIDDPLGVSKFHGAGMYLAGGRYRRPYRGRIALLIDETCAGSCELFAAAMKEAGAATLIGRRTRGSLLFTIPVTFDLFKMGFIKSDVKGWTMNLPVMEVRTASGKKIEGHGIEPDLVVERDAGDRSVIDRALSWLRKK